MSIIGAREEEESKVVHEFFESISQSERIRLYNLFKSMMEGKNGASECDWSDKTKDGTRLVPSPGVKYKSNGRI